MSTYLPGTYRNNMGVSTIKNFGMFCLISPQVFFSYLFSFSHHHTSMEMGVGVGACDLLMRLGTTVSVRMTSEQ